MKLSRSARQAMKVLVAGSMGVLPKRKTIWLLFDTSNSNPVSRNYIWWFPTRAAAIKQRDEHDADEKKSNLVGPFAYVLKDTWRP